MTTTTKKRRGFAAMDPELQRELSQRGGTRAQALGTGHRWRTKRQAAAAGRKGAQVTNERRRA